MFIYLDKNGVVREIINEKSVRIGDVNADTLYFFFDGINPSDVFITMQWGDLTKSNEISIFDNVVEKEIPYNKDKDYRFFKDYKKYKFYTYTIPEIVSDGLASATIRIFDGANSLYAQGLVVFNVEEGVIKTDHYITQSQYDYLVTLVARNNLEIKEIKYNAEFIEPTSIKTEFEPYIEGRDILKIHARPNFNVESMRTFMNTEDVEEMFYGCGVEDLTSAGFSMNFDNAQIGKVQLKLNGNKYGDEFRLNCYATSNGVRELVDTIVIPPMEQGVFAFFRFNVYKTDVTKIEILQEEGWFKDRFYVKSVEPFALTGEGYYEITQKNGIVSRIDNPDTNFLYTVYQYVNEQMNYIKANIDSVSQNAQYVQDVYDYIEPKYPTIVEANDNFINSKATLEDLNSKLNQPNGFAQLGADGKLKTEQIPAEKVVDIFRVVLKQGQTEEDALTSLTEAQKGDIAIMVKIIDNVPVIYKSWRLLGDYFMYEDWVVQGTSYAELSFLSKRSELADDSSAVNGISFTKISLADYNKLPAEKTGTYLVVLEWKNG